MTQEPRMTTANMMKHTISTREVSVQERIIQGEMSQKKWLMTLEPQKDNLEIKNVGTEMVRKPPIQETAVSHVDRVLFMMVV